MNQAGDQSKAGERRTVRVDSLPSDQLQALQKQIRQELEGSKQAVQVLVRTAEEYGISRDAVTGLSKVEEGDTHLALNIRLLAENARNLISATILVESSITGKTSQRHSYLRRRRSRHR
jgi:hypothetical protein